MHRNIARAYDDLKREHDRIRAAHVRILAQNDRALGRHLFRADLERPQHLDEMLLYEGRLWRQQRRRVLELDRYARKIELVMDAILRL